MLHLAGTFSQLQKYQGAVAQLVRASACHAEGRGFESRQPRHYYKNSERLFVALYNSVEDPHNSYVLNIFSIAFPRASSSTNLSR